PGLVTALTALAGVATVVVFVLRLGTLGRPVTRALAVTARVALALTLSAAVVVALRTRTAIAPIGTVVGRLHPLGLTVPCPIRRICLLRRGRALRLLFSDRWPDLRRTSSPLGSWCGWGFRVSRGR